MDIIDLFEGEYAFLSNFYPATVEYNGLTYLNSEAAFQAQKCAIEIIKNRFCNLEPDKAKKLGRQVLLRSDWELIKDQVMYEVVKAKFTQHEGLARKLIETGNAKLVEGNTWRDYYWGVYNGMGQNKLGQILMEIREELKGNIKESKQL